MDEFSDLPMDKSADTQWKGWIPEFAWVFGWVIHIPHETDIPISNPGIQPLKEKCISWISSQYHVKWIRVKTAGEWSMKTHLKKKNDFFPGFRAKNTIILGKIHQNLEKFEMWYKTSKSVFQNELFEL